MMSASVKTHDFGWVWRNSFNLIFTILAERCGSATGWRILVNVAFFTTRQDFWQCRHVPLHCSQPHTAPKGVRERSDGLAGASYPGGPRTLFTHLAAAGLPFSLRGEPETPWSPSGPRPAVPP